MNTTESLQGLIELAVLKRKTSVRQLGFIAQDAGYKVVGTTLGHIRGGRYKSSPSDDTIRAIAYLAGVDESVAFAAAGRPVPGPPLADELPPGADNLSPKARKAIIDMARLLIEYETDSHDNAKIDTSDNSTPPRLRSVAPAGDAGPGQKTGPRGYEAEDALDQHGITQISGPDAENIPVPPLEQLAAHPNLKSAREKWEEIHGERGEENQERVDRDR